MTANEKCNFSDDELTAPTWLNTEFFTEVFRDFEGDNKVEIVGLAFKPGAGKNDHYASTMFKVNVEYKVRTQKKSKRIIIKIMPEVEGAKKDFLKETSIFETEISIYREIIPKFEKILNEVGDETKFGVPIIYTSLRPHKIIILEDMTPHGYTCITDRQLDLPEVKMTLAKLAKFQAISFKLNQEVEELKRNSPGTTSLFESYCHSIISEKGVDEMPFMTDGFTHFLEMLEHYPKLQKYKPYFLSIQDTILETFINSFSEYFKNPNPRVPYVLSHGDFHARNLLVKRSPDDGKLQDIHLIDYQMCHMNRITADLRAAHFNMANRLVRENHLEEIDQHYLKTFNETLRKIGYKKSLIDDDLWQWLNEEHKEIDFFYLSTFLPVWNGLNENNFNIEKLMTSAEYRKTLYQSESLAQQYEILLPKFDIL